MLFSFGFPHTAKTELVINQLWAATVSLTYDLLSVFAAPSLVWYFQLRLPPIGSREHYCLRLLQHHSLAVFFIFYKTYQEENKQATPRLGVCALELQWTNSRFQWPGFHKLEEMTCRVWLQTRGWLCMFSILWAKFEKHITDVSCLQLQRNNGRNNTIYQHHVSINYYEKYEDWLAVGQQRLGTCVCPPWLRWQPALNTLHTIKLRTSHIIHLSEPLPNCRKEIYAQLITTIPFSL